MSKTIMWGRAFSGVDAVAWATLSNDSNIRCQKWDNLITGIDFQVLKNSTKVSLDRVATDFAREGQE